MQKNNIWIIGLGILLVVSIGLNFYLFNNQIEFPEEKALLTAVEIGLYENLYDSSEMFFNYRVDNYGNVEAKNVKVKCKILDKNQNLKLSVLDNTGSVASNSNEIGEVVTKNIPFSIYEDGTLFCYIESCDNCEILSKNIPELREIYEIDK